MTKRVILITGTPCTGKTTLAHKLTKTLNATYINLTELAENHHLVQREDKKRHTKIINETKMRKKLQTIINNTEGNIIIDGHYAAAVTPKTSVTHIFILRRNPTELHTLMQKNGFKEPKIWENLASEILDVCLTEAIQKQDKTKICELDITGKTVDATANEVMAVLDNRKKCSITGVDWIGTLEAQGILDEYLHV